ncbi:MAG: HD-GYP domain-containing protein [Phycisphaerae bacterium]|nr:HD-GYP domain-containing protein [Phycisphaerae bacterium]
MRLPSVAIAPIGESSARRLMVHWRGAGVWLAFWNARGRLVWHDRQGPRVWTRLLVHSGLVRSEIRRAVRGALAREASPAPPTWGSFLGLAALPILQRKRIVGVVTAAWRQGEPDEDFQRFCDRARLDAQAIVQAAAVLPSYGADWATQWGAMLQFMVQQARESEENARQIESFTRNLGDTYEELNLVYSVGGMLSLDDAPHDMLQRLGREMLTVCKAAGIVFVQHVEPASGGFAAPAREVRAPRCVCVGQAPEDPATLRRLAETMGVGVGSLPLEGAAPSYVLRNNADELPEFSWAADWLDHIVALPLDRDGRRLGAMIALNRTDGGDYSSIEVKFLRALADRVTSFLESQHLYDELADLLMGLLHALISSIDAKDPYTCGHSQRVAAMSRRLAQAAGFEPAECHRVYLAGLLHDVGKIGIPDAILCKPGKLTEEEFRILRKHPEIGARILSQIRQVQDLLPGVLYHHERMDGRGYPHRLAGKDIPLLGRIICLADCFDAMTTNRTYRSALPIDLALAEVRRCAGTQFDPELAEKFLEMDPKTLLAELNGAPGSEAGGGARADAVRELGGHESVGSVSPQSLGAVVKGWQRLQRRQLH